MESIDFYGISRDSANEIAQESTIFNVDEGTSYIDPFKLILKNKRVAYLWRTYFNQRLLQTRGYPVGIDMEGALITGLVNRGCVYSFYINDWLGVVPKSDWRITLVGVHDTAFDILREVCGDMQWNIVSEIVAIPWLDIKESLTDRL